MRRVNPIVDQAAVGFFVVYRSGRCVVIASDLHRDAS